MESWISQIIDYGMIAIVICSAVAILAAFIQGRHRKVTGNGKIVTSHYDDYYPSPRKVSRENKPVSEDGFHKKLNYQFLIERLTRKLYFCFIFIVLSASSFGYVLYKTSLTERIAPTETVMIQYEEMMTRVMSVEDKLEGRQIATIQDLDSITRNEVRKLIKEKSVEYEDELVADVSKDFFNIYFYRYIAVRILVATILFIILRYFIRLYFKIREDRSDYIRKEEALSTMFYFLDVMEGEEVYDENGDLVHVNDPRYTFMRDRMPDFPLHKLFEGAEKKSDKSGKGIDTNEVISSLNSSITLQREMINSFRDMMNIMRGRGQEGKES